MIDQSQKSKYYELEKIQAKEVSHKIGQLKPRDRNIELKAIVLQLLESYETKNREKLLQYLIADETGSIIANFFGESGSQIKEGDIIYINGGYTTLYKERMILYQGKANITFKIGEYFYKWLEHPNVSLLDWGTYEEKDTKK